MERLCRLILHIRDEEGAPRLARCYVWSSGNVRKWGRGSRQQPVSRRVFGSTIRFSFADVPVQVEVYHGFNGVFGGRRFKPPKRN